MRSLLIFLVLISLFACRPFKVPQVQNLNKIGFQKQGSSTFSFEFGLEIHNPNVYRLTLLDMDLDLIMNNRVVGKAQHPIKQVLPVRNSGTIQFTVHADLTELIGGFKEILSGLLKGDSKTEFRVKGVLRARAAGLTKRIPVDYAKGFAFSF